MRSHRTRRALMTAVMVGLTIAVVIGLGSLAILRAAVSEALPSLEETNQTGAETVGTAIASQLERALAYGIPLDRLYGLDTYFTEIVTSSPQIDALSLKDSQGDVVFETANDVMGLSFPVVVEGRETARLFLATSPALLGPAIDRLWLALAINAIAFGLIAGLWVYVYIIRHISASRTVLRNAMRAVVDGTYPTLPPKRGRGAVAQAYRAYEHCLERLREAARILNDALATVTAIDFDGSLRQRAEPIVAPFTAVLTLSGDRTATVNRPTATGDWLAVIILGLYAATVPFVANFGIDRQWDHAPPHWWPVLPVLADVLAALLGYSAIRFIWGERQQTSVAALGIVVAAVATAAVCWTRDYSLFLGLRFAAAFGIGIAIAVVMHRRSVGDRPLLVVIALMTVLTTGPILGGLLGEAIGRRLSFLTIGIAMVAVVPAILALGSIRPIDRPAHEAWTARHLLMSFAVGVGVGAVLLIWIPARPGYDDYLTASLMIAVAGLAAVFSPIRSPTIAAFAMTIGLAIDAAPVAHPALPFAVTAFIGAGIGPLLGDRSITTRTSVLPIAAGLFVGAASVAFASGIDVPDLSIAGVLVVVITLIDLGSGRIGRTTPAS